MRRPDTKGRLSAVLLTLCSLAVSGCACRSGLDPTGRRIFAEPPGTIGAGVRDEPGAQLAGDDVAVTLSPHVTVAPVGSEVVLLAGVRGPDNYLRTNRRLEWSLAPGGVGQFVAVGKNRAIDWLVGDFNRPRKVDNTFAIGSTSRRYVPLNRGTPTTEDDMCVVPGQGWITLTSPVEGTSNVSVFAPSVGEWDARTRSATVHWVDAQWAFPPPAINPAGSTHTFTTTVIRQSDRCPCEGWLVRYEIVDGPAAGFSPDGGRSIEVATDTAGQASAEVFQKEPGPGTNKISIQIIRPASLGGPNGKRLVIGSGATLKTWTSADLAVRKSAPAQAGLGTTLNYTIEVSNPGDLPAEDVLVSDELPEGLTYLDSDPAAEATGGKLQWQLGQLGAGQTRTIQLNCRVVQSGSVTNCANATAKGGAAGAGELKASDCATTTVTPPAVDVKITGPKEAKVGSEVTFDVVVTNPSQVKTPELKIKDRYDSGFEHAVAPSPIESSLGELAPGQSQRISVTFRVAKAGRWCHQVEVTGAGGIRSTAEACLTATGDAEVQPSPQPVQQPSVSVEKTGPRQSIVGKTALFSIDVTNTGRQTLTEVRVVDIYPPSLSPNQGTKGYRFEGNKLVYVIDSLAPGQTEQLDVLCSCLRPAVGARNRVTVTTREGARAEGEASLDILAAPVGLTMTVSDLDDPVAAGNPLRYNIVVTNKGQESDTGVTLTVTIPAGTLLDRLGTMGPGNTDFEYDVDSRVLRFRPVAEILPNQTLQYRVRVQTRQHGKATFQAELNSANLPQPLVIEESTDVFQ